MINLIIGTETGTAEFVADEVLELLTANNIQATATLEPELEQLTNDNTWIIITSTHGAGEVPPNLQPFTQSLQQKQTLTDVNFIVIALGDSSYDTFCQAGLTINDQLITLGAKQISPILKVDAMQDDLPEDIVIPWLTDKLPALLDLN